MPSAHARPPPPPPQANDVAVYLQPSRRYALRLLWASSCVMLLAWWSWRWRWSAEVSHSGERQDSSSASVIGLRTRDNGGDSYEAYNRGGATQGLVEDPDWYPIPDHMEQISRPPEVEDYLTGADFLHLFEEGRRRTEPNNSNNKNIGNTTAAAAAAAMHHDRGDRANKFADEAAMHAAAALGDSVSDVPHGRTHTALDPGWKGMPTAGARCSSVDMTVLAPGMAACGAPLSAPCFDHARCRPRAAGGPGPSIYVFDATCSLANSSALPPSSESPMLSHTWREMAKDAGVLSETYGDACLFLHVNKRLNAVPCPADKPLWHGGKNHVMVDLTDRTRDKKKAVAESSAMDASSNMRSCYYRSGYDFAVPLRHKRGFSNITDVAPWHRKYFLTVNGNLYLSGAGFDERFSVVQLHSEPDGVVTALKCFGVHEEHLLPENEEFCNALNETASRHDYGELMNTTFGLVPAGRQPATYRLAEVMSAGAIPVFVARDMVRPFPERVDWPSLSFSFSPEEVGPSMMAVLRSVEPAELLEMQRKSVESFYDIFGEEPGYDRIARVVIDELVRRLGHHR
ncbi:unnamed protein product [Pylaiella littoralis]